GEAVRFELPSNEFTGGQSTVGVVLVGSKGRPSEVSNVVTVQVVEPLTPPTGVKAEPHAEGVRVTWAAPSDPKIRFRVIREPDAVDEVDGPEYIDRAVELGKEYKYSVIALLGDAESLPGEA